eukprot:TRINITY_DN38962_c0_g1_i1.p1 TRINITY_DN38962_c0_g1~~TRINITY_DN38962_c0_g1_i1.p1  ORF type:complete len:281 (+),score=87.66 TRINITY_DN38962_c0_g1_i1:343-1185(+)
MDEQKMKDLENRIKGKEDEISDAKRDIRLQKEELMKTTVRMSEMVDTLAAVKEANDTGGEGNEGRQGSSDNSQRPTLDKAISEKKQMIRRLLEVVEDQGRRREIQAAKKEKMMKQVQYSDEQILLQKKKMVAQEEAIKELVTLVSEQSQSLEDFQSEHFPQKTTSSRRPEFVGHAMWLQQQQQQEKTDSSNTRAAETSTDTSKGSTNQKPDPYANAEYGSTEALSKSGGKIPDSTDKQRPSSSAAQYTDTVEIQQQVPPPVPGRTVSRFILRNNIVCSAM